MVRRDPSSITRMAEAEASAWLARLQGARNGVQTEQAFRQWLDECPDHAVAFDKAAGIWEILPGVASLPAESRRSSRHSVIAVVSLSLAALVLAVVTSVCVYMLPRSLHYETAVGQQRWVTLADGSRVLLNTNSAIDVDYRRARRNVALVRGEAMFVVAHDAARPFIVVSDDHSVLAIGTRFFVRRDPEVLSVILAEGVVAVSEQSERIALLHPGERLRFLNRAGAILDHPSLDAIGAWSKARIIFTDVTLLEAAREINRYTKGSQISIDPSASNLRISGVFATGDSDRFVAMGAALYGLQAERRPTMVRLFNPAAAEKLKKMSEQARPDV